MMVFTLDKAMEAIEKKVGDKEINHQNFLSTRLLHAPLSEIPGLGNFFEEYRAIEGQKRAP